MVIKNTLYNLLGLGLPLLVAVGAMPVLIHSLGDARFGVLTLIWAVVSYFGLFDLGLGRALTQQLSELIAKKQDDDIPPLVFTSVLLLTALGVFAAFLVWFGAPWGALHINYAGDSSEVVGAVHVMAIAMPFIVLTSGLRGILEAKSAFGIINLIRLPMGVFTFIGPLAVVFWYESDLVPVTVMLTAGRIVAFFAHAYYAARLLPGIFDHMAYRPTLIKKLLISGGWMTVSNIISPLMGYLDRFLIGATVSAAAVAYYVTPFEIISKLWIIPGALTAVLFPKLVSQFYSGDSEPISIVRKAIVTLFVVIYPITLFAAVFAYDILKLWINSSFAQESYFLLQVFSFGLLVSCLSQIPFTIIQSAGKFKLTALIHAVQLPLFAMGLWIFTTRFGLVGAVFTWLARILIDATIMLTQAGKIVDLKSSSDKSFRWCVLASLVIASFMLCLLPVKPIQAVLYIVGVGTVYAYMWQYVLQQEERLYFTERLSDVFRIYLKK